MQISMLNSTTNSQPIPTKFSEAISRTYMQVLTSGQADRLIGRTLVYIGSLQLEKWAQNVT